MSTLMIKTFQTRLGSFIAYARAGKGQIITKLRLINRGIARREDTNNLKNQLEGLLRSIYLIYLLSIFTYAVLLHRLSSK